MVGIADWISSDDPEVVGDCSIMGIIKCNLVARNAPWVGPEEFFYVECV